MVTRPGRAALPRIRICRLPAIARVGGMFFRGVPRSNILRDSRFRGAAVLESDVAYSVIVWPLPGM